MGVFFLIVVITILIQFIPAKTDKDYRRRTFISFIPLFLYGALRFNFGLDYDNYEEAFNLVHQYGFLKGRKHQELGFRFFCSIIPSFRVLIIIQSFLVCFAYYKLFYKFVPKRYSALAMILFFLSCQTTVFFMFSGIRNAFSISLFILSYTYMAERRIIPFAIFTVLAASMHTSAAFVMPMGYLIANKQALTAKHFYIFIPIMLFFMFTSLSGITEQVFEAVGIFTDRYDMYMEQIGDNVDNRGFKASSAALLQTIFTAFLLLQLDKDERSEPIYKLGLFCLFCSMLGNLNYRLSCFFLYFSILSTVRLYSKITSNNFARISLLAVVLFVSFYGFKQFYADAILIYASYQSVLQ